MSTSDQDDLADFVRWAAANPAPGPNPELVSITCEQLAIHNIEQCADRLAEDDVSGYRLLDAVRALHLSMVAAMTATLGGSAGIGAVPARQKLKAVAALNRGDWDKIPERFMSYAELLDAVQTNGAIEWGAALVLTPAEQDTCMRLNALRERIDHPKVSTFIEARSEIRRICTEVAVILPRIIERADHHYEPDELERVTAAVQRIAELAVANSSGRP